jgi:hypothetical protein
MDPQSDGPFVAGPDPEWFNDFILYDSDDLYIQADPLPGPPTSMTLATIPLFASSPRPALATIQASVLDNASLYLWPFPIDIQATHLVESHSNSPDLEWNPTEPDLGLSPTSHSETTNESSQQYSPAQYISTQNDASGGVSVPRTSFLKCPTCQYLCSSEYRLRWVVRFCRHFYLLTFIVSTFRNPTRLCDSPVAIATDVSSWKKI